MAECKVPILYGVGGETQCGNQASRGCSGFRVSWNSVTALGFPAMGSMWCVHLDTTIGIALRGMYPEIIGTSSGNGCTGTGRLRMGLLRNSGLCGTNDTHPGCSMSVHPKQSIQVHCDGATVM